MKLSKEIFDLVVSWVLFGCERVNLHRGLLVGLVSRYGAAHYLQRSTQLTNLSQKTMLFIFDQNVLVAGLRNMSVHVKFIVTHVSLKH